MDEIRDNLRQLFVQVLKQITGDQIEALAITNQRESAAAWSRSSGKPLCKTVVWQDNRAASLVHELSTCQNQKMIKNKTGLALSPYFTAAKWAWMLKNEPAVQVAADHDDLCFGTMDSWLLYQLTDGRSFKTEPSNACRTQLMNLHDFSWDNDLCQLFNIPKSFLPEIVDSNACFGLTDLFGLLDHKIPICSILGDSQAALFAHGCFNEGDFKVTFGTGSSIMLNLGDKLPENLDNKLNTSLAWSRDGHLAYVLEGNINYAGACITWLKDQVKLINTAEETSALAQQANPNDHTVLIPAFAGLGSPYWLPEMKAAFVGMTANTGRNELVRAALNSVVFQISDTLHAFIKLAPCVNRVIHVDGGMIHNQYLMQFLSDITQRQVDLASISELSALGTAMNAMGHAIGSPSSKSYYPELDKEAAEHLSTEWTAWISKLA